MNGEELVSGGGGCRKLGREPVRSGWARCAGPPALRLAGALLQFFATVLIARVLGDDRSGEFFFWSAVLMSFGGVATLGMDKLSLQQVPRLDADRDALASFLATVRGIAVLLSLAIGSALALYALATGPAAGRQAAWYLLLPAGVAGVALCRINGEAMKGMGRPMLAVLYRHLAGTGIYVLLLLVIGAGLSPELALMGFAGGFCLAGLAAPSGPGFAGVGPLLRLPGWRDLKSKFWLGLPICASALLTAFNYIVPLGILERWHESAEVAYLTTSYRFFMLFEVLALAVYAISMPGLSRASQASDWHGVGEVYRASVRQGLLVLGAPVLFALVAAEPLMSLFGESFVQAAPVLRILLVVRLVTLCLGPAEDLVLMTGHTGKLAAFAGAKLAVTVAVSPFVIPAYGAAGMAVVIGGGILLQRGLCLWWTRGHARRADGEGGAR